MTFPQTVRVIKVEMKTGTSTWTDITSDVQQRDSGIQITRGKTDLGGQMPAATCSFMLNNRLGKYSPRNPLSPYFKKIGRGTQVRVTVNTTSVRFVGEMTSLPPAWDTSGRDAWVKVTAAGLLRRYDQGTDPATTGLREWVLGQPATLAAYYPLSGGEETQYSQNIAPGITGSFSGRNGAVFTYGHDMGAAWLGTGLEINATGDTRWMQGDGAPGGAHAAIDFVFQSLALGVLDVQLWPTWDSWFQLRLNTSGDAGTAQVSYYDGNDLLVTETATALIPELQDTELHTCRLQLSTGAGPQITYTAYIDGVQIDTGNNGLTQSLDGAPLFRFLYSRYVNQTYVNIAHVAVWADDTLANLPTAQAFTDAAFAYAGETAADRMTRITGLAGWPFEVNGTAAETMPMGPIFSEPKLAQLRDAEAADMGFLMDKRSDLKLVYRTRASLYNQSPAFTLDKSAGQVAPPFEPAEDDQYTRNIVTATRREGGSVRVEKDSGALSTLDPPNGVGPYYDEVTVNVQTDGLLAGVASWLLNQGTVDETRYPSIAVNLANPDTVAAGIEAAVLGADIGDKLRVTNADVSFIYDDIDQLIIGYVETINAYQHDLVFNCVPASPYDVATWATSATVGTFHWDTDGSELNSSATSTATSLSVKQSTGATSLWTIDANAFPFDILVGGERMTVTAISGATSPQTFTVTRSVNGVVKAQAAGTDVRLFSPGRWAL